MSDYHAFDATGQPGTCLWCGRKLRRKSRLDWDKATRLRDGGMPWGEAQKAATTPADKLGDYQDDSFCGLRCGYQFGVRMAELGKRLVHTSPPPPPPEENRP